MPPLKPDTEAQLLALNRRIRDADAETSARRQAADEVVRRLKENGRDVFHDADAFQEADAAYRRAEAAEADAQRLRAERDDLFARVSSDGGRVGNAPSLRFEQDALAQLHQAAMNGQALRVEAVTHAVGSTELPQAGVADFRFDPWPFLRERTRIAELIPTQPTDAPSVHVFRSNAAASAAAAVAEGGTKPESSPTWQEVTLTVRKLAHWAKVNDEVIADFSEWLSVVGDEMLAGLVHEENDQLLNGNGTAPNLTGILNTTGIGTVAKGAGEPRVEAIHKGITTVRLGVFTDPEAIIMHPNDLEETRFEKTSDGEYLTGDPLSAEPDALWGIPVVTTTQIAEGTALIGAFSAGARLYVRQLPTLEVHPGGGGQAEWAANQTLIRAEERLALGVIRAAGFATVTGL